MIDENSERESSVQPSAFILDEPENVQRGKSVILWTKILVVLTLAIGLLAELVSVSVKPFIQFTLNHMESPETLGITAAITALSLVFLCFVFFFVFLITVFKFCIWLYITIKNLRKFTKTDFHPVLAVGCTLIPLICGIFDYFIFKDILSHQEKYLTSQGAKFVPMKQGMLKWILILTILNIIPTICSDSTTPRIITLAIFTLLACLYIKAISAITANEKTLSAIRERDLLNRKIDEILAQRENS